MLGSSPSMTTVAREMGIEERRRSLTIVGSLLSCATAVILGPPAPRPEHGATFMASLQLMRAIWVRCDGNWEEPEVDISGNPSALRDFGRFLKNLSGSCELETSDKQCPFYPVTLKVIRLELLERNSDRIVLTADETGLNLSGPKKAFSLLGKNLETAFPPDAKSGDHYHFDHFVDDMIFLAEAPYHLIVCCE